jgi:hypothetical protein
MQPSYIVDGRFSRSFKVQSFIDHAVFPQAIPSSGARHELPESDRSLPRSDIGNEGALRHSHVFEVIGHSGFGQFLLNVWKIAPSPLEPQKNLGPIPDRNGEFSIQHLQNTAVFERYGLTTQADRTREGKVRQNFRGSGLFGVGGRGSKAHNHKIESQ